MMTAFLPSLVASCFSVMAFLPLAVRAEEGRITFTGMIVEPTCDTPGLVAIASATEFTTQRMTCLDHRGSAVATQGYTLSIVRLTSAVPDHVLQYFVTYVKAARPDAADPVLLTKVYE
jgi:type 1 fimbria pilin